MKKYLLPSTLLITLLFVSLIGPWPVSDSHFLESEYAKNTLNYIDKIKVQTDAQALRAGVSSIDITPPIGFDLGGYSARTPKANTGVLHPVFAKAITLDNDINAITLVSAEILLPMPELVKSIVNKTGLKRKEIFFATSHTHSGPGAYSHGIISAMALGEFNQTQFDFLSGRIAQAILESRKNLSPVEINYRRIELTQYAAEQFIQDQLNTSSQTHNSLHLMELNDLTSDKRLATLISFSAHPTFLGKRNKLVSGDYPGAVMLQLEDRLPGTMIFAAGAVGGMLPKGIDENPSSKIEAERQKLNDMSLRMAALLTNLLSEKPVYDEQKIASIAQWTSPKAVIQSDVIPVHLPSQSFRLNDDMRLSPFIVNHLFHDRETFIHALRIGKILFLGYPADYSGESARDLEIWAADKDVFPWATSFNGDYIGYIMPTQHYDKSHHTVRNVNFFGRWSGDYFSEISQRAILNMFPKSDNPRESGWTRK